jgi:hypothetical protein
MAGTVSPSALPHTVCAHCALWWGAVQECAVRFSTLPLVWLTHAL